MCVWIADSLKPRMKWYGSSSNVAIPAFRFATYMSWKLELLPVSWDAISQPEPTEWFDQDEHSNRRRHQSRPSSTNVIATFHIWQVLETLTRQNKLCHNLVYERPSCIHWYKRSEPFYISAPNPLQGILMPLSLPCEKDSALARYTEEIELREAAPFQSLTSPRSIDETY